MQLPSRILAGRKSLQCWAGRDRVVGQEARSRFVQRSPNSRPRRRDEEDGSVEARVAQLQHDSTVDGLDVTEPCLSVDPDCEFPANECRVPRPEVALDGDRYLRSPGQGITHPGAKPIKQRQLRSVAKATARRIRSSRQLQADDAEQPRRDQHERHVAMAAALDEAHLGIRQPDRPADRRLTEFRPIRASRISRNSSSSSRSPRRCPRSPDRSFVDIRGSSQAARSCRLSGLGIPTMDLGLTDRRFLVTGASRGLGAAVARALAAEGVRLALAARPSDELTTAAADLGADAVPVDLSSAERRQPPRSVPRSMRSVASMGSLSTAAARQPGRSTSWTRRRGRRRSPGRC